jgi:hypothetical protein
VHLAGETSAGDILGPQFRLRQRFADGNSAGPPPVFRILFGPADLRRSKRRMLFGRREDDFPVLINDQSPGAARANVNAK